MSRQSALGGWCVATVLGLVVGVALLFSGEAGAQAPDPLIQAQLDAGEFAPALAAAQRIAVPEGRDAVLAQIGLAQAQAGARGASLATAGQIGDDRARARALADVGAVPFGGRGGGTMADFDSLIELITTTVAPETWEDVGGVGSIAPFPTGVYVDAQGVLRPLLREDDTGSLAALRASSRASTGPRDVRRSSPLRKVSLPRLEKHLQLGWAAGREPTEAMLVLAGLQRVRYVFVYPESGDVVLAGPAGNWQLDDENRVVSIDSGQPVVRLDDLVVIFRQMLDRRDARFGCLIKPRGEGLARVQALLAQPVTFTRSGQRSQWLEELRSAVGTQDIEIYGLDPRTRAARVMIEADYRMKLVGMGLEEGVPGVNSYLDLVSVGPGQPPPTMDVLRWWFTLNYDAVLASHDRSAFAVRGQGVKVLSENELLTAEGQRVHTGQSEPLNRQFARSFTEHFEALCRKYPIYAELRNLCDLALVGVILREEDLAGAVDWHMTCFGSEGGYQVEWGAAPKTVETVANYRVIRTPRQVHTLAGVSGGVRVDPTSLVAREAIELERYGPLGEKHSQAAPNAAPPDAWWWD